MAMINSKGVLEIMFSSIADLFKVLQKSVVKIKQWKVGWSGVGRDQTVLH